MTIGQRESFFFQDANLESLPKILWLNLHLYMYMKETQRVFRLEAHKVGNEKGERKKWWGRKEEWSR